MPVTETRCGVCRADLRAQLARRVSDSTDEIAAGWWRRFMAAVLGEERAPR